MRSFVLFLAVLAFAAPANAGLFDFFRIRSAPRVASVRVQGVQKSAPKYRYECKNGTCRRIEVK